MNVEFPDKAQFLFEPHRGKGIYGGRGKGGSWSAAQALLLIGTGEVPHYEGAQRVLCGRETQKSIADSVHALLEDRINAMGLRSNYEVEKAAIYGKRTYPDGSRTEFMFHGLKHNISNIKSVEGVDEAWIEEAATVSKDSWEKLIPSVRKMRACSCGAKHPSELWAVWNPELTTDDTHKRWVLNTPPDFVVRKMSWRDNPWFPEVLRVEKDHLQATDHKTYMNVWEGECKSGVEGGIYTSEIAAAESEGRITNVPYDRTRPVTTVWDLGFGDKTAIWFLQAHNGWWNFIDYEEDAGQTIEHYIRVLQAKPYIYGEDWVPHDAVNTITHAKLSGHSKHSIEQLMRNAGRKVRMVPMVLVFDRINAGRTLFASSRFDSDKCADGLQALRHYQWGPISANGVGKREPLHDWASHGSDSFQMSAIAVEQPRMEPPKRAPKPRPEYSEWG